MHMRSREEILKAIEGVADENQSISMQETTKKKRLSDIMLFVSLARSGFSDEQIHKVSARLSMPHRWLYTEYDLMMNAINA